MSLNNLLQKNFMCRVSSVLQKDTKQFGKNYMFDGEEDSCWNSDQGSPQSVILKFESPVIPASLCIQFQGGFAGKECWLEANDNSSFIKVQDIFPEDNNKEQIFPISSPKPITSLKIVFNKSTDFFGRIVIYKLSLLGSVMDS